MGIHEGGALSEAGGPAFGRGVNIGAEADRSVSNMPMATASQAAFTAPRGAPNAGMFPGYPQDMMMAMDDMVAKPETFGLRPGWSGGTMGMMTIVRVVKPELFDKIQELKAEQTRKVAQR